MCNMRTCEPRLADSDRSELLPRRSNRENTTIKSFTAITSVVGKEIRFIGNAWEDESFRTDEEGNPIRDRRGNTISKYTVAEIGERDSELLIKAFGEGPDFMGWMLSEGVSEPVARSVADQAARLAAESAAAESAAAQLSSAKLPAAKSTAEELTDDELTDEDLTDDELTDESTDALAEQLTAAQ